MMSLITGDWRFFWPENLRTIAHIPFAWDSSLNTGIGIPQLSTLWITSYLNSTAFFSTLGFSWDVISILFWFLPAVVGSFFSAFFLFRYFFPKNFSGQILAGI